MDATLQQLLQDLINLVRDNEDLRKINKGLADQITKLVSDKQEAAKAEEK